MRIPARIVTLAALSAAASPAWAQAGIPSNGDTAWLTLCALLLLLGGIGGLALHALARVQARHALSAAISIAVVASGVSIAWALVGYSLAFGPGDAYLGGATNLMLANLGALREGLTVPESAFALFSLAIAVIASGLTAAAVAGRARLAWLGVVMPLWSIIGLAPIARWLWGDGWLSRLGAMDYAGGLVLGVAGGSAALVAAMIVGRRSDLAAGPLPVHAPALGFGGVALIWIAMLALSGGWALGATDDASTAILNAHLSAAGGAFGWALFERFATGRASGSGFGFGILAGLAAISASSGLVGPGGAILIGLLAGLAGYPAAVFVRRGLHVDDVAQVFATFAVGGALGALLALPFADPALGGIGFDAPVPGIRLLLGQFIGIIGAAFWSGLSMLIAGYAVSMVIPARVSPAEEAEGMDLSVHGERGWTID